MNTQGLAEELNELLATETRSLAQHFEEATPYQSARTFAIWRRVQQLGAVSRDHAARLSHLIDDLDLPPRPRPFSMEVACYHDIDVAFALGKMVAEKRKQLDAYQRALSHAGANDRLLEALGALAEESRDHLKQLESSQAELVDPAASA